MRKPSWHKLLVFGYEPNHSTTELATCLNLLLTKGHEWLGQPDGVFIGAGDAKAAFDNLSLAEVRDALLYFEDAEVLLQDVIIHAFVSSQWLAGQQVRLKLDNVSVTDQPEG